MPEESPDYEVADGLPEDQEEAIQGLTVCCTCGAELRIIAGTISDVVDVCKASGWTVKSIPGIIVCPRCQ